MQKYKKLLKDGVENNQWVDFVFV